jgi:hypothetical protein
MSCRREDILQQGRERIASIRAALNAMGYFCSGTLLRRMKVRQTELPLRRGSKRPPRPILQVGMKGGKLVHRVVSPE